MICRWGRSGMWAAVATLWCWLGAEPGSLAKEEGSVVDIGQRKQLLFDDHLVETRRGVEFVQNQPYQTGELLVEADQPHEAGGFVHLYSSVLQEPDGRVRLWYDLLRPTGNGPYDHDRVVAYAESTDGIHFTKPALGLHEVRGHKHNNIVLPGVIGGCAVWLDPQAPPAHRYKTQAKVYPSGKFQMHSSPDGVHWSFFAQIEPKGPHDTQSIIFWDRHLERYLFYGRQRAKSAEVEILCRSVRRGELKALTATEHEIENTGLAFWPDALDRASYAAPEGESPVDYYGATVYPYSEADDVYVMLAQAFWHWLPTESKAGTLAPGRRDVRLALSRDSRRFERPTGRQAFLKPGPAGRFDSRQIWVMPNPIIRGDEIWFYYAGLNWDRTDETDYAAPGGARRSGIGRAILRLDGFVSADAGYQAGELVTKPIRFTGSRLELNVDTGGGGSVRVEVLDADQRPIPGFSGADSPWLVGNSVRFPVSWKGAPDLTRIQGQPLRLRFHLRDCKLYAFQFRQS